MHDIPQYNSWIRVEFIDKGWSEDQKYYIQTKSGEQLLLRLSNISQYEKKKQEFEWMQKVAATGIPMSQPVEFGVCGNGQNVYSLLAWVNGEDAQFAISRFSPVESYNLGIKAGELLRKIHSVPVPDGSADAEIVMKEAFRKKLIDFRSCSIAVPHEQEFLRYMEETFPLLHGVKQHFLHGDYHVGNMIIGSDDSLSVIDFNRFKFGDPYRDFSRMTVFSRITSVPFARGQIDGYWGRENPSDDFFPRMAFYSAFDNLFSVLWAIPFGEQEVRCTLERSQMIFEDFTGFTNCVPKWYLSHIK